jgi:hypothetical protein
MGFGSYSHEAHEAITSARAVLPRQEVFKQTRCHHLMDPRGVHFRESRDSATHPNSLGVVFALDVTGSMGKIPELLARKELPRFMTSLFDCGVTDPQVLFLAVGDATSDAAPLQVGQFESAAREMDQWLTWSFLEGGGGNVGCESYELALYFIARHTAMDCWEKRKRRGYLFMTGDESPYPLVSRHQVKSLLGDDLDDDVSIAVVVRELQRAYEPFFLIPDAERARRCERVWRDLLGDRVIVMDDPADTCAVTAGLVALSEGAVPDLQALAGRLKSTGVEPRRLGAIVRALTPFAATLGRDSTPKPRLESVPLPSGDDPSGFSRSV